MCLQCQAETKYYVEFAPGWHLVRATKTVDGEMNAGDWGLVRTNDPDFILSCPIELPDSEDKCIELVKNFTEQLYASVAVGHSLYDALLKVKYPFAVKRMWAKYVPYVRFEHRFYLYLAWLINNHEVKEI